MRFDNMIYSTRGVIHWFRNENDFMYDYSNYEKDELNGRCYILEDSICLRADCDGKLVKRRIKKSEYEKVLQLCKDELGIK